MMSLHPIVNCYESGEFRLSLMAADDFDDAATNDARRSSV
jgi:hypothetical protein